MGYWNEVCFMSGLPILSNESVYAFVLMPRIDVVKEGAVCYKDDKYVPIGFPIKGKYNEYGGIDDIQYLDILDRFFKTSYDYFTEIADENYNKSFVKYKWMSVQRFVDDISSRDVYTRTADGKMHRLALTMIHSELYDLLLEEMSNRVPYSYYDNLRGLTEVKIRKNMEKLRDSQEEFIRRFGVGGMGFARFTDVYFHGSTAYLWMNRLADMYLDTNEDAIIQNMVDYILWMMVMDLTNKGYMCQTTGSQSEEYRLHQIIAEFILSRCKMREIEYERDNEGDIEEGADVLAETLYFWDD